MVGDIFSYSGVVVCHITGGRVEEDDVCDEWLDFDSRKQKRELFIGCFLEQLKLQGLQACFMKSVKREKNDIILNMKNGKRIVVKEEYLYGTYSIAGLMRSYCHAPEYLSTEQAYASPLARILLDELGILSKDKH